MNRLNKIERESIAGRLVEFLVVHPPFDQMAEADLITLANASGVQYLENGEVLFRLNDTPHESIYAVRKGKVRIEGEHGELIDVCSEGDLFGARAFMDSEVYRANAIAEDEALLILLPVAKLREIVASDPKVLEFFFGDFSSGAAMRKRKLADINAQVFKMQRSNALNFDFENSRITSFKDPVTCPADFSIRDAAHKMTEQHVGSILVVSREKFPIGIVTDTDLRKKVVTGLVSIDEPVEHIMSSPVVTVPRGKSSEEYLMQMLERKVHHLCVTENGLENEPVLGVVTDHDLLVSRGSNAAALLKSLRNTKRDNRRKEIVERFDQHILNLVLHDYPILDVARINSVFNRELLACLMNDELKAIEYISKDDFCLIALGSIARNEQIIRTDFDSALILSDRLKDVKGQLKELMDRVFEKLVDFGFQSDKAGIQANNPTWILTVSEWRQLFLRWMEEPTEKSLLHSTIFFDLTPFYGRDKLAIELQHFIQDKYLGNKRFTAFLAQNALQNPPPLGFFKTFLLEKSGEHRDAFDIKARAMMPLADAARLRSLESQVMFPSSTIERYQRLREKDATHAHRYEDCAVAYEIFMRVRAKQGLRGGHDGRYISPDKLSTVEKQMLKKAFEPIAAIQHLIKPM